MTYTTGVGAYQTLQGIVDSSMDTACLLLTDNTDFSLHFSLISVIQCNKLLNLELELHMLGRLSFWKQHAEHGSCHLVQPRNEDTRRDSTAQHSTAQHSTATHTDFCEML